MFLSAIFRKVVQTQCLGQGTYTKKFLGGEHLRFFGQVKERVKEGIKNNFWL